MYLQFSKIYHTVSIPYRGFTLNLQKIYTFTLYIRLYIPLYGNPYSGFTVQFLYRTVCISVGYMSDIWTLYTCCIYIIVYTLYIHCIYSVYTLYIHCICSVYTLYIRCIYSDVYTAHIRFVAFQHHNVFVHTATVYTVAVYTLAVYTLYLRLPKAASNFN